MSEEDVLRRLDSIIGILNLAFADPIERARNKILGDPVMAAILEELGTELEQKRPLPQILSGRWSELPSNPSEPFSNASQRW